MSGTLALVTTHGISMQPRVTAGHLIVVGSASSYGVRDAAAYRSAQLKTVVLHRIVAVEGDRYVIRGDNNSWLDPDRPAIDDLVGKELLHIPQGGAWLSRLTSPPAVAWSAASCPHAIAESERIRVRHKDLLLAVLPITLTPGRPVVDVTDLEAPVRLAERYGLLVLHWQRSGVTTYVVQDEGATYRFRSLVAEPVDQPVIAPAQT